MSWRSEPVRQILTSEDERRVVEAIRRAEGGTSGEIRVHVEGRSGGEAIAAARKWFHHLGMDRTALANGVLIYVAVDDHAFAIVGDRGIHEKVGETGWQAIRDDMQSAFVRGAFLEGLIGAIERVGGILAGHFPPDGADANELPDTVSR